MFIPSIYKSTPQSVGIVGGGTAAISSVDINYTRLTIQNYESADQTGALSQSLLRILLNSAIQIGTAGQGIANVLVEEYLPGFFRQAFVYNTLTITPANLTGTYASGLTLGPKAFVAPLGYNDNISVVAVSKAIAQITATLSLNIGTGVVTGTRFEALNVPGGDTGDLTVGFIIMDPR